MPELPEVETVVRTLSPLVNGRRIVRVTHLRSDMVEPPGFDLAAAIEGRAIQHVVRRAKRIVFSLDDKNRFFIHLGMTGRLSVEPPHAEWRPHTHWVAELETGQHLRLSDPRRFGAIVWLGGAAHDKVGPEPLTLRADRLIKLLQTTRRPIKIALLNQRLIAGIGNIYADEALHRARIDPRRPAFGLDDAAARRLNRAIKYVLRRAIRAGGSTIRDYVSADGSRGSFQNSHRVYDREGKPCRNCGRPITRIVLGGRSTHWCETCQR